jgi:hypothetical protein
MAGRGRRAVPSRQRSFPHFPSNLGMTTWQIVVVCATNYWVTHGCFPIDPSPTDARQEEREEHQVRRRRFLPGHGCHAAPPCLGVGLGARRIGPRRLSGRTCPRIPGIDAFSRAARRSGRRGRVATSPFPRPCHRPAAATPPLGDPSRARRRCGRSRRGRAPR